MTEYEIAVIGGDGIGPEVTAQAMRVMDAAGEVFGFDVRRTEYPFGTDHYLTDIQLKDRNGMRWTYYWSYADQYSRFDFIFVNKGLLPELDQQNSYIHGAPDWFTASDHHPCVAKVRPVNK